MSYKMSKVMMIDEDNDELALVGLDHQEYGRQIWDRCTVRKKWTCRVTGREIESGDTAYRPVTDGQNRMHRISVGGMVLLLRAYLKEGEAEGG